MTDRGTLVELLRTAAEHENRGEPEQALAIIDRVIGLAPLPELFSHRIFLMDFIPNACVERQQEARRRWWENVGSRVPCAPMPIRDTSPSRKLVVGYVSGDFRHHSAATCFGPVIAAHDRNAFDVICYYADLTQDLTTAWFRAHARFTDAARLSDLALAHQVEADQVDILVDLSGHTLGNRLGVFARKPAPVQVTAWGHATGTGLPTIDYMLADPVLIPPEARQFFAERIYDLPCAIISEPPPLPCVDPPALTRGYVTFGAFNRASKLTDASLATWAKVLDAVPNSRLLIKAGGFGDPAQRHKIRSKLPGISPARIEFMRESKTPEHLAAAQEHVDVMLDPFPQNGGVTSWETLYCGLPLVTLAGATPPGRLGASILTAIGQTDWIARTEEEYVTIAARLASDAERLRAWRHDLAASICATESGNIERYTRAVECGYRTMWAEYCHKQREAA